MLTRYGRNNIGFLWLFVEPMLITLVLAIVWTATRAIHGSDIPDRGLRSDRLFVDALVAEHAQPMHRRAEVQPASAVPPAGYDDGHLLQPHRAGDDGGDHKLHRARWCSTQLDGSIRPRMSCRYLADGASCVAGLWPGADRSADCPRSSKWSASFGRPSRSCSSRFRVLPSSPTPCRRGSATIVLWLPMLNAIEFLREGWFGSHFRAHYNIPYVLMFNTLLTFVGLSLARQAGLNPSDE